VAEDRALEINSTLEPLILQFLNSSRQSILAQKIPVPDPFNLSQRIPVPDPFNLSALGLPERFAQPVEVAAVIFLAEEARFAIVAALHDVQRDTVKMDARAAGHVRTLAFAQE
jgi:hypothetical protein